MLVKPRIRNLDIFMKGSSSSNFYRGKPTVLTIFPTTARLTTTATLPHQETTMGMESTVLPSECPDTYYEVGDRCVQVNPFMEGTWDEARYYCHTLPYIQWRS